MHTILILPRKHLTIVENKVTLFNKIISLKKLQGLGLSVLCGLLLAAAWPVAPFTLLIYIAFVPLLLLANLTRRLSTFFGFALLSMLIWNACTTWWMWNSTSIGAVAAIIANSLFMTLPWLGYFTIKKKYTATLSFTMLVCFWMGFEYIHLNWELSWPWLTLGNVFANMPSQIQWYEYTGVGGGSLLILMMNLLVYELIVAINAKRTIKIILSKALLVLLLPLIISFINLFIYLQSNTEKTSGNMVIVQPNIDPYQKFELTNAAQQINQLITLSEQAIDSNTKMVIWPETAMSVADWQDHIAENVYYQPVFEFAKKHPDITLLSGIETFKNYGTVKETATAHHAENGTYYDAFNAAIAIKSGTLFQLYNKSKLVPGVESLPSFLRILSPIFEQFGGSTGGYGKASESAVFKAMGTKFIVAPIICYESIYGEYVSSYVQKGANVLTIITNDGWWGNTPGHKQHLAYARLRAIETRRWVARSANTGISAVINEYGAIVDQKGWNMAATIKYTIPIKNEFTFYVKYGDYLFKIALFISLLFLLYHLIISIKKRFT